MKLLVISNMHPSKKDAAYGTFVAVFVEQMERFNKGGITDKVVIRGRPKGRLEKLWKYICFYLTAVFVLTFYRYDLIYVHTISHTILPIKWVSRWKKLPLVFNVHGGDVLTRSSLAAKLKNQARPFVENAVLVVVPSDFFKQIMLREFSGLDGNRIFVSPSGGIDEHFFLPSAKPPQEVFTIGYVSRISDGKGWDVFLRAARKIMDEGIGCQLLIAGGGEEETEFKQLIVDLNMEEAVNYLGAVAHSSLPDVYRQMDLFVFPTCLEESLGLVGLEAMASRVPIIGSRIGGLKGYIKDGENGFFFTPGNAEELAAAIKRYLALSPKEKEYVANRAYQTAEPYEAEMAGKRLFEKINSLV